MRALCTVSAPLSPPSATGHPPPPSGSRYLVLRAGYPPTALPSNSSSNVGSQPVTNQPPLAGCGGHQPLYFLVEAKSRVRELQARMAAHLAEKEGISAEDAELFGLAVLCGGEYLFTDPDSKLSKYAPKSWRASHTHGLDANGRPLLELYYRVRYYVEAPGAVLRDVSARRRYYEQLKENAATREHRYPSQLQQETQQPGQDRNHGSTSHLGPNLLGQNHLVDQNVQSLGQNYQTVGDRSSGGSGQIAGTTGATEQALLALGGLALQVDKGDAPEESGCAPGYFDLEEYAPQGLRNAWGAAALRACHLDNAGLDRDQALAMYLRDASRLHDSVNCHVFRMRASKLESGPGSTWLSVGPRGLRVAPVERSHPLSEQNSAMEEHRFPWPSIAKLSFDRRKFEIRSGDKRLVLYSAGDDKSKLLLALCRDSHQFSLKMAPRLAEARKREDEEDRKRSLMLRDCCVGGYRTHALRSAYGKSIGKSDDQRVSVISSTSSNTTSGIVSDRVHSEDELEIMIDTPPVAVAVAAPSTESLAFAHLLDGGASCSRISQDVSRQTSSVGQVSLKDLEETLAALSIAERSKSLCASITEQSYPGGSPTPPMIVESLLRQSMRASAHMRMDSHASAVSHLSSKTAHLSTAAQAATLLCQSSQCSSNCSTDVATVGMAVLPCTTRRASAASSLELGYSHTAQNSALSQESTTGVDTAGAGDGDYGSSVREEDSTSGVYTLRASETSGVYTMASSEPTTDPADSDVTESLDYGSFLPASVAASDTLSSTGPSIDQIDSRLGNSFRTQQNLEGSFGLREDSLRQHEDSFAIRKDSPHQSFALRKDSLRQHEDSFALREDSLRQHEDAFIREDTFNRLKDSFRREDSFAQRENSFRREEKFNKLQDSFAREDSFSQRTDSFRREDSFAKKKHQKEPFVQPKSDVFSQVEDPFRQLDDAFRPRTDSTISASGSFHGDGSDPTDARRALLSADELSELIVGKPDAECDYVLLPNSNANGVVVSNMPYSNVVQHTKDPPPYPTEAPARFVTTRPNINILTAHASAVNVAAEPSYSSNRTASIAQQQHRYSNVSSCNGSNNIRPPPPAYPDELILRRSNETTVAYRHQPPVSTATSVLVPTMQSHLHQPAQQPIQPQQSPQQRFSASPQHHQQLYQHDMNKYQHEINQQQLYQHDINQQQLYQHEMSQQQLYQHDLNQQKQYQGMKQQQHHRQYLPPPPPPAPIIPRRPPPPPVAAVVTRSQLEQFQQQLYSDVDYVIYPLQDPAISKQEYLDSKLAALAAAAHASPPPYPHRRQPAAQYPHHHAKGHVLYRSAPYLPLAAFSTHSRYASTQNLSDAYVQLPAGYSTATLYAAAATRYEAPPPPLPRRVIGPTFTRARSDDNILNSIETATRGLSVPRYKRLPPPPPPPITKPPMPSPPMDSPHRTATLPHSSNACSTMPHRSQTVVGSSGASTLPHRAQQLTTVSVSVAQKASPQHKTSGASAIGSAKTTSNTSTTGTASVAPQPGANTPVTSKVQAVVTTSQTSASTNTASTVSPIDIRTLREKSKNLDLPMISALCNDRSLLKQTKAFVMPSSGATKLKYSVNAAAPKKTNVTGQKRNPNDKLPALPGQEITTQMARTTTKGNNYVLNGPGCQKHKSVHSQS